MKKFLLHIGFSIVICLFFLEAIFTWVVPASSPPAKVFVPEYGVFRFDTANSSGIISKGRTSEIKAKFNINNVGFASERDYYQPTRRTATRKVIALLGDSYVSSFLNTYENHFDPIIESKISNADVYNFGMPGSNLAQNINYQKMLEADFNPDLLVILVTNNDLDESISNFSKRSYEKTFEYSNNSVVEVEQKAYIRPLISSILSKSSLFNYIVENFELSVPFIKKKKKIKKNNNTFKNEARRAVADEIISRLITSKTPILFVLQHDLNSIYENDPRLSEEMKIIKRSLEKFNGNHMSLESYFYQEYKRSGLKFEFEIDKHWNANGNRVVSEAIAEYIISKELI